MIDAPYYRIKFTWDESTWFYTSEYFTPELAWAATDEVKRHTIRKGWHAKLQEFDGVGFKDRVP